MNAVLANRVDNASRERATFILFAALAIASGVFIALGTNVWLGTIAMALTLAVIALTAPLSFVVLLFAALLPFQIFFEIPGSALTMRGTLVMLAIAALRVLARRLIERRLARWDVWVVPAAFFLCAALLAAFGADNRYAALKGIFDWLTIFATVFVIAEITTPVLQSKLVVVIIAGGVVQGLLGLIEYVARADVVIDAVQSPLARWVMQPNLVKERLVDFSFNWYFFDRITAFGTFINAIDYAIFLAAILALVFALLVVRRTRAQLLALLGSALIIGLALLLSFKSSGLLAVVAGLGAVVVVQGIKSPARTGVGLAILAMFVLIIALPFADLIGQRIAFVVERELGQAGSVGRLKIWTNLIPFIAERPLFGFGLNNSIYLTEPTNTLRSGILGLNLTASENAYLALLIETGVIGLFSFGGLLLLVLQRGYRHVRASRTAGVSLGMLTALIAMLTGNLTVVGFTAEQNAMLLGILLGMIFARHSSLDRAEPVE